MGEEVNATTIYHVTRMVGERREYLVGTSCDNTWAGSRAEASGWDTEESARGAAKATHDSRSCVERYTIMIVVGDPVFQQRPELMRTKETTMAGAAPKVTRVHEVEFIRGGEVEWVRIGLYDSARRRSLWCRLVGEDETGHVQAIELCSGREGDDAYVRLTPADPQWEALCDLLLRVEGDCGLRGPMRSGEE